MDQTPGERRAPGISIAILLIICCALPLLLLSGVSLVFIRPYWPIAGAVLALLGVAGFIWYLKRGWPRGPRKK